MADQNTINLAAAIINDKRYSELKTAVYEDLVKHDHATVVAVFRTLQDYAIEAKDNSFNEVERQQATSIKVATHDLDLDPDLDISLTEDELNLRK
jgi:anti-sigma regulatory factor (Ser/Thr protein kinase)